MDERVRSADEADLAVESETELLSFAQKMLSELEHCQAEPIPQDNGAEDDVFADFDEMANQ